MPLTQQQIDDAGVDLTALGNVVNGAADFGGDGLVDTRTGGPVKTLARAINDLELVGPFYPTEATALAAVAEGAYYALTGDTMPVPDPDVFAMLYRKVAGVATAIKSVPSLEALEDALAALAVNTAAITALEMRVAEARAAAMQLQITTNTISRANGVATDMALPYELPTLGQRNDLPAFEIDRTNVAGTVTTFGPYIAEDERNLIKNNKLTDTSLYIASGGVTLSTVLDTDGYQALVATCAAASNPMVYTELDLPVGETFRGVVLTIPTRRGTVASGTLRPGAGTTAAGAVTGYLGATHTGATYSTATFYAAGHEGDSNGSKVMAGFRMTGTITGTLLMSARGLGAYLADPFAGFPQGKAVHLVKFTPVAGATKKTIVSFGDDGTRNFIRLTIDEGTGALALEITTGGVLWGGGVALGNVSFGAEHTVAFRLQPDSLAVSVDGGTVVTLANVSIGGAWKARMGGDSSGNTFSGAVNYWAAWRGTCHNQWLRYLTSTTAKASRLILNGDSFSSIVAGDGLNLGDRLQTLSGRSAHVIGVGGSLPPMQYGYWWDVPGMWDSVLIDIDGGNGQVGSADQWMAVKQRQIMAKRNKAFILLPSIAGPPANPDSPTAVELAQRDMAVAQTALLAKVYPDNYVNPLPGLQALSTGVGDDLKDTNNGFAPRSVFQGDLVHLDEGGQANLASQIWTKVPLVEALV
jgi:hypothetical protein